VVVVVGDGRRREGQKEGERKDGRENHFQIWGDGGSRVA
jgi:hypothetical protein